MSTTTGRDVQEAIITYSKSKSELVSLLPTGTVEIRESEWQGEAFQYPNVRIGVDFFPGMKGCQPIAEIYFDVFSEKPSSLEASTIAGVIQNIYHRKPFSVGNVKFFSVIVEEVSRPQRSIFAWQSRVKIRSILT